MAAQEALAWRPGPFPSQAGLEPLLPLPWTRPTLTAGGCWARLLGCSFPWNFPWNGAASSVGLAEVPSSGAGVRELYL